MSVRLAAVADVHCGKQCPAEVQPLLARAAESADVLALCGDLTDFGLPEEAQALARELATVKIPMVGVLGNHDFESGRHDEVKKILGEAGLNILDGESYEVHGIGFAGAKGFGGGFGRRTLEPWGESVMKMFVQEAVYETLKLETSLARLRTKTRVALLHYAPVQETVEGEPPEIFCFLGSSRLEEPINRYEAAVVFHGHAHRGAAEGRTRAGIPVYNVSMSLMRKTWPDRPPLRIIELEA